ncbi:hypothetical protein, partial [Mycolicibacterium diernhoferi]|uniref:hypothetical protein n=2 Tax=Mycolicibacterium diernhoferi TaxID=1801 RepID=UPI0031D44D4A
KQKQPIQRQVNSNQKNSIKQKTPKLASKKQPSHVAGRRGVPHQDGQKQQTKTTKHTIEFSNNRPDCEEVSPSRATLPA